MAVGAATVGETAEGVSAVSGWGEEGGDVGVRRSNGVRLVVALLSLALHERPATMSKPPAMNANVASDRRTLGCIFPRNVALLPL